MQEKNVLTETPMHQDQSPPQRPLDFRRLQEEDMRARSKTLLACLRERRSVREFSQEPIPIDVVRRCIETAAQAPSGANKQPWTFALVTDPKLKQAIRVAAEKEERAFYGGGASDQWLRDLEPIGTGPQKPFLAKAPALVVVFAQRRPATPHERNYYVSESVGIAVGFLLAALHHAGLATLTHTPSPMKFLSEILGRPKNESPYMLLVVGYPAEDCRVPQLERKTVDDVLVTYD
jgi:iodotyrosine deiodinase